jgi:tetratricopeptide (TPR) repeat protein
MMDFLERSTALDFLHSRFQDSRRSQGSLVFLSGEMGIGKTTLVDRFIAQIDHDVRLVKAPFEGLSIPEPLGPLLHAVRHHFPNLHHMLESDVPRVRFFGALLDEIRDETQPVVLVNEDVHWADEASLDLLRFLGRRVESLPLLLLATLRDDELSPDHPLRRVLGDLVNVTGVHRLQLPALSLEAVSTLAVGSGIDPVDLHAYTGGNPFFVSEIVASGSHAPMSLQDAILGRAARLSPRDREVLDAAATMGAQAETEVVQQVVGRNVEDAVDLGLAVGLLRPSQYGIAFRHAAVQSILLTALSAARRQALHKRILSCLSDHPSFQDDVSRLAFHAEEANDPSTFTYATAAAERATALQSHREAAEQYARALRWSQALDPATRAGMLEAQAYSYYLTTRINDAIAAQEAAAGIWQHLGRDLDYGNNLRRLSRFYLFATRHRDAVSLAERAYDVLARFPDSSEFVLASGYLAEWRMRQNAIAEALELGNKAMNIASRLDDEATIAHALITIGTVRLGSGDETGIQDLERGLDLARKIGNEEFVLRALTHLAEPPGFRRLSAQSRAKYIAQGVAFAREHALDTKVVLFAGMYVRLLLDRMAWPAAITEAEQLVSNSSTNGHYLLEMQVALGLARISCGEPASGDFNKATALAR